MPRSATRASAGRSTPRRSSASTTVATKRTSSLGGVCSQRLATRISVGLQPVQDVDERLDRQVVGLGQAVGAAGDRLVAIGQRHEDDIVVLLDRAGRTPGWNRRQHAPAGGCRRPTAARLRATARRSSGLSSTAVTSAAPPASAWSTPSPPAGSNTSTVDAGRRLNASASGR